MRYLPLRSFCSAMLVVVCLASTGFAEDAVVVAEANFDGKAPHHIYSYAFAGYGDSVESKDVQVKDQLKVAHGESAEAGKEGSGAEAKLDSTALNIPLTSTYEYAGWALGTHFELTGKKLPSNDLSDYEVSFDAKVGGTTPLMASKLMVSFVVEDGKGEKEDDDDYDDAVLELVQGEDDGTGCLSITSNYKTFTYDLDDLTIRGGSVENLKKHTLKGLNISVQAQGTPGEIGKDADNVLHVDNVKLTKKAS